MTLNDLELRNSRYFAFFTEFDRGVADDNDDDNEMGYSFYRSISYQDEFSRII